MASIFDKISSVTSGSRTGLIAGAGVILALTIAAYFWIIKTDYSVLFTDLESQDLANIVSELERSGIDYRIDKNGKDILVESDKVHETRLKLMDSDVLLKGSVGFELFDDSDFGMTEFAQKINYQRALQGELTRTISSLKEVKYVRIHLVMPDKGLFKKESENPSASVVLFMRDNMKLGPKRIQGIQRLVAASVPGMKYTMVTVTDQTGETLSSNVSNSDDVEVVSTQLEQRKQIEEYLTEKVSNVLKHAFGPDKASVSINVVLNFDNVKSSREDVLTPEGAEKQGVKRMRESKYGVDQGGLRKTDKNAENVTTEFEYELGRRVEQIIQKPGKISRLSIAVMVPEDVDQATRDHIRDLASAAAGLDKSRGDEIVVVSMNNLSMENKESPANNMVTQDSMGGIPKAAETAAPMPRHLTISQRLHLLKHGLTSGDPEITVVSAFALILLVLGLYLVFHVRRGINRIERLTPTQREEMLIQIKKWLQDENVTNGSNVT